MARSAALRASDADRDGVVERLREAAVEGRLEPAEFEERVHAALRARTYGELRRLLADLPGSPPYARRRQPQVMPNALAVFALALRVVVVLMVLMLVLAVVALMAAWWLLWVFVWFMVCARRGRSMRRIGWMRPVRSHRLEPRWPL